MRLALQTTPYSKMAIKKLKKLHANAEKKIHANAEIEQMKVFDQERHDATRRDAGRFVFAATCFDELPDGWFPEDLENLIIDFVL